MKAGKLNLWMTHYRRAPGVNELGEPSPDFTVLAEFAAGVVPVAAVRSGDEFFNTGHMAIRIDRQFQIRYSSVKAEDRVSVGGVMYDVLSVATPDEVGGHYELKCKSVE